MINQILFLPCKTGVNSVQPEFESNQRLMLYREVAQVCSKHIGINTSG